MKKTKLEKEINYEELKNKLQMLQNISQDVYSKYATMLCEHGGVWLTLRCANCEKDLSTPYFLPESNVCNYCKKPIFKVI